MSKKNLKHAFVGQDSEDTQVKIEKACSLATYNQSLCSFVHSASLSSATLCMKNQIRDWHTVPAFYEL